MALSEATIKMNFNLAKAQADKLDEIAGQLSKLSENELQGTLQNVSSNWKGENASAYLNKGGKLQGKITTTSKDLQGVASEIRAIAKRIYDTEMANLAIAQSRTYQ